VTDKARQYDRAAEGWSEEAYADPAAYLARRAELIVELGPALEPGDTVLDLACGDGGLAEFLLPYGLAYRGVDSSAPMVEAARRRLGGRAEVELGDLNGYEPPAPVAATTVFRAIYYARDRAELFRRAAGYTRRKLLFDLNPRQYRVEDVERDLRAAGFGRIELRPFFTPQTRALPRPLASALRVAERSGPAARLVLRFRFTYVCAASPMRKIPDGT
jgi:SAM-dependent methyltransferase